MMLPKALIACLLLALLAGQAVVAQDDPQNDGSKDGADVSNDDVAAGQDQEDMQANADAVGENLLGMANAPGAPPQPVISEANEKGGKGGVDPATGETLLPLPEESEFCKGTGQNPSDGTQQVGGSCSSVSQGQIPSVDKMVSTIIIEPQNQAKIPLGQDFQVSVVTANMKTGFFDAAATEYYTQPQTLDDQGVIKGHQHITVQRIADKSRPPNANEKQFFKGLNDAADGSGKLSVTVNGTAITEPGLYRICSMTGTFAHQPVVMPVAQRGAQDDCIRVDIVDEGNGNDNNGGNDDDNNNGDDDNNNGGNNNGGNNNGGNNNGGNDNGNPNRAAATAGNNGAPARAAATAGNARNNNNPPARAAATATRNNNRAPPARAAATATGNNNNRAPPARAAATATGNNRAPPARAAATATGNTGNTGNTGKTGKTGMHGMNMPSSAAATATGSGNARANAPPRAAATATGTANTGNRGAGNAGRAVTGAASGQGRQRSAKEIIAEMRADLDKLENEL